MADFEARLWQLPLLMCLTGLLWSDICLGQRLVQVQEGPLYRVEGYPVFISCNVSGFKGPDVQDFVFSVYKPNNPNTEIKIISTNDKRIAYAGYLQRVSNENIVIKRISGSSVLLHIKSLQADDSGTYECYTPNTDPQYFGTYSAKTTMNVVKDTLKATYAGPASHSFTEGGTLQLECQVSSETFQHTHLSVTWYLQGSPIISLDRDLTVRPGTAFENRYNSGLISMEKVEDTTYRLKITQAQPSDSGQIYCQAEEWIQDPDRTWIRIAHKNTTGSDVGIKAIETTSDVGSFISEIEVQNKGLQVGEDLQIQCRVIAQNLPGRFFSMAWLKNSVEVAQIGPSGVLTVAKDYKGRDKTGELKAVKFDDKVYILTLRSVRSEDQGKYQCKASQEERTDTGTFNKGQSQLSPEESVLITTKESGLAVVMTDQSINVTEGQMLQITCSVSGASGPLSVTWQHKKTGGNFNDVISLSREGVMEVTGSQYLQRGVRTLRSNAANFLLEISEAIPSDTGEYKCIVTEWNMESNGNMKQVKYQSAQCKVSAKSIDSSIEVALKSRDTNVAETSRVQMICAVKAPKVPLAVKWKFQATNTPAPTDIACMLQSGVISCGAEQRDYQMEAQVTESGAQFILRLLRVRRQQQGTYQCQVEAYQHGVQKAEKLSNRLAVTVQRPVSKLTLTIKPTSSLTLQANSNTKVDLVISTTLNSSRLAVAWELAGTKTLLKMDKDGVITHANPLQTEEKFNIRMMDRQTFQLTISQIRSTDAGRYRFMVEEWIEDPDGNWYSLQSKSADMLFKVTENAPDFKLDKTENNLVVTEGENVNLGCSLGYGEMDATFQYSLSWIFEKQNENSHEILTYSHDGRLQFHSDDPELQARLQFSRPATGAFRLSILNSITSDSGRYHCKVDKYQLDCKGKWELKASDTTGFTNVNIRLIESSLEVNKENMSLSVTDLRVGFPIDCEITSPFSEKSVFQVTWTKSQTEGNPLVIFTANKDGTLYSSMSDRGLVYEHPSSTLYTLTIPNAVASDNGQYQCQVEEFLEALGKKGEWRKLAMNTSGYLTVHIDSEAKSTTDTFILEKSDTILNPKEGETFLLGCSVKVDKVDPTFQYTLTWILDRQNPPTSTILLKYNYDGYLQYHSENQQLKNRLQFYTSNARSFHLTVQNSVPDDSGIYRCKVEQYQIGCKGKWEQKGSEQMVTTEVNVRNTEANLRVKKEKQMLNVTDPHKGFTIDCEIVSRSSEKSVFEVTWTKSQREGKPLIIFNASRDGVLHSTMKDRGVVYDRPSNILYRLRVPDAVVSDIGQYQCQVVEFLQTVAQTWRKVATDTSEEFSVHLHTEGSVHKDPTCTSEVTDQKQRNIILAIFILLLLFCLIVIAALCRAYKKAKRVTQKQKDSLWAENNPLKPGIETKEGEGDCA